MTTSPQPRLRADARRNRDQILAAAREVFVAQGPDVPMEEIARAARVGVGTLYRRFPDRETLIRAVARESIERVLEDARAAETEEPTAWDTLVRLFGRSQHLQLSAQLTLVSHTKEILFDDPQIKELRDTLVSEIVRIVKAAQEEGTLRTDVSAGDVMVLLVMLLRQPQMILRVPTELAFERTVAVMLDGLRAQSHDPLPGQPLGAEALRFR